MIKFNTIIDGGEYLIKHKPSEYFLDGDLSNSDVYTSRINTTSPVNQTWI